MERKFARVKEYDFEGSLSSFLKDFFPKYQNKSNLEGFILRFPDGYLIKGKLEEYKRLHRLITGLNEKDIWEALREERFASFLEEIPDEMYGWVENVRDILQTQFDEIERAAKDYFINLGERKANAEHYLHFKYPSILFHMLDKRDYKPLIWKLIKPKVTQTFKVVAEDSN